MAARRPGGGESDRGRGRGRGVPAARVSRGQERCMAVLRSQYPKNPNPKNPNPKNPNPKSQSHIPNPKSQEPKSQIPTLGFGIWANPKIPKPKDTIFVFGFWDLPFGISSDETQRTPTKLKILHATTAKPKIEQRTLRFEQNPRTQELGFDKTQGGEKSLGFASQIPSSANPKVYKPKLGICVWDLLSNTNPKSRISQGDALSLGYAEHIPSLPYPNDDIPSFFFNLGI